VCHLPGLRGLTDRIAVSRDPAEGVSNEIEKALERGVLVDAKQVIVTGSAGVVTLTGEVRSTPERNEIER